MKKTVTLRLGQQELDHLEDIKKFFSTHPGEKTNSETIRFCIGWMWDMTPEGQKWYKNFEKQLPQIDL